MNHPLIIDVHHLFLERDSPQVKPVQRKYSDYCVALRFPFRLTIRKNKCKGMCKPSGASHFFLLRSFEYPKGTIPHQSGGGGGIIISARQRDRCSEVGQSPRCGSISRWYKSARGPDPHFDCACWWCSQQHVQSALLCELSGQFFLSAHRQWK